MESETTEMTPSGLEPAKAVFCFLSEHDHVLALLLSLGMRVNGK